MDGSLRCNYAPSTTIPKKQAIENSGKLALAPGGKRVAWIFREIDTALLFLRTAYENDPQHFNIEDLDKRPPPRWRVGVAIFDCGPGYAWWRVSRIGADAPSADISDREHFLVHANNHDDVLFIGKPLVGRLTGRLLI